ncbi:BQ5605_C004g03019 [Microbotryum silenes-dioicae]|uniref:BQ5605_C004g03019 protein n=1 Tax=Microbotryum silenes-dioicae TaxID=796604 RepID=A0A2X0MCT8_9BASI|nr:BQ5605_C004g03019 [Microbotryum silenes-dioicae]
MASTSTFEPTADEVSTITTLLADVRSGASQLRQLDATSDLDDSKGISLLSLKNHLLLSYLHHLVALLQLKLACPTTSLTSPEGSSLVATLIKHRIVLEKISPLEGKLKYQIEKLVRRADQAAHGVDDEEMMNDPLAFKPNISNLVLDRTVSEDEDDQEERAYGGAMMNDDSGSRPGGIYRPPRVAAVPYTEAPAKGAHLLPESTLDCKDPSLIRSSSEHNAGKKAAKRATASHLVTDMSTGLSALTPYGESTTGLSASADPTLTSGTARHLKQVEQYEMDHFTRMRMSKKDAKKRRAEEEEVAFGGLGAGRGGKRRLGGYGAEFDDLLGEISKGRNQGAYDAMKKMKRDDQRRSAGAAGEQGEGRGSNGLAGFDDGSRKKGSTKKNQFDRAVGRARTGIARAKRG